MTRHILAFIVCGILPLSAAAQSVADAAKPLTITPETHAALLRLGGQMVLAGKAYEYDRQLSDEIGPRVTGSANYVKAVDWAVAEFKRLGLANVHRESWEIPATWEPETLATAHILAPHEQRLHLESEGWSPSTPPGGVRGNIYYLTDLTVDGVKSNAAKIKGAITLIDGESIAGHEKEGFGKLFEALNMLHDEGAVGLIFGIGTVNNAPSMIGNTGFTGSLANIPCGNLGLEDSLLLKRLLDKGPVQVEFSFTNRIREHVKVDNVVADLPGRDASGEYVIVGGHLDSWHPGTGAQDNGTGAASVLAVAEAVKAAGLTPRRTMRFILFGGEEEGLLGSVHYARDHAADSTKCVGVFVSDTGAEPPRGWYIFGRKDEKQALSAFESLLDSLGAGGTTDEGRFTFQTDEGPFLIQGVPSFVLWTAVDKYMAIHHKPSDTFDKVNQRDLALGAAVVGITSYAFADSPDALKHYSQAELEEQLKSIKALDQYKDLTAHKLL